VQLSPQQEVALGPQARSEMAAQYGGLYPDNVLQQYVDQVGAQVMQSVAKSAPYPFEFHLLRDPQTVNAFALPGGQVFAHWSGETALIRSSTGGGAWPRGGHVVDDTLLNT